MAQGPIKKIAENRKARHNYEILETLKPCPFVVEIKSRISQQREVSNVEEHAVTDPQALLNPIELFQDFYAYKEGIPADPEALELFTTLVHSKRET